MHFCSECHNMYYLKIRDTNEDEVSDSLIYYCRNCGHEDSTLVGESICVSDTQLRRSEQKFTNMVTEYTKYDPTLPRINTIKCPNQECSSNMSGATNKLGGAGSKKSTTAPKTKTQSEPLEPEQSEPETENLAGKEVIYIRYDDINMKYVYLCVHCDTTWKTDNR
jgi:DNA-directed RNA polymerase subunit M/transcription elongation factor TFIIS